MASKREEQVAIRRENIIEAAVRLFSKYGFDATSTKQIANEAHTSEGLIFYYFPTKASLLAAVLYTSHAFVGELREILNGAQDTPASHVLPQLAMTWINHLKAEKAITLVLFGTAQANFEAEKALNGIISEGVKCLAMYLQARITAGELREDLAVESSALMFFAALIIFFLTNRSIPEDEWKNRSSGYVRDILSVWTRGAMR